MAVFNGMKKAEEPILQSLPFEKEVDFHH